MSTISIIVAMDSNRAIGNDNKLLCHLPNDLKYFKKTTQGHPIIMGRKTFESLPNGALPNRRNIVLSRNKDYECRGCELSSTIEDALALCRNEENVFIIGGATVYEEAINFADELYVTHIDHAFESVDSFFPEIDNQKWIESSREDNPIDEKNKYAHSFVVYERRK